MTKRNNSCFRLSAATAAVCSLGAAAILGCSLQSDGKGATMTLSEAGTAEDISSSKDVRAVSEAAYDFILGEIALREERFDEASDYYQKAAKREKRSAPTLRKRLAQLYLRKGELDKALKEAEKGLEQDGASNELIRLQAGILASQKKNKEAIAAYNRLISIAGAKSDDPYILLASLYLQENDIAKAKETLSRLLEKKPRSFIGIYYLARLSVVSGDLEQAEALYKKAMELTPSPDVVELDLARVYALQKKYDKAIEATDAIIKRNPGNTRARELRGDILLGEDRVQDALREFEAVENLEADPSQTRLKIALVKLQRRDFEGAEVDFRLVISQQPNNSAARYYLASTYAAMKRTDDAMEQIRAVEKGEEFYVESQMLGIYLLREAERFDEALKMVGQLASENPKNTRLLELKATLQHEGKRPEDAVQTIKRLIEMKPEGKKVDEHYFSLGVYYDEAGDKEEAIKAMRRAIELNPDNSNALNYLGYTYAEMGTNLEEAKSLIEKALAIQPKNGYYIDSLGWVYFKQGKLEDALRELERASSLVINDAVVLEHLARVQAELGRRDEALRTLERAEKAAPESEDKGVAQRIKELLEELRAAPKTPQ